MSKAAVTVSEATEDFLFIFESLKNCYRQEYPWEEYDPSVVVGDGAEAISSAADHAFNHHTRVHCWSHVILNIGKNLVKVKNPDLRQSIRHDIEQIQLAKSEVEFDVASFLWINKWGTVPDADTFVEYFKEEYFDKLVVRRKSSWFSKHK